MALLAFVTPLLHTVHGKEHFRRDPLLETEVRSGRREDEVDVAGVVEAVVVAGVAVVDAVVDTAAVADAVVVDVAVDGPGCE